MRIPFWFESVEGRGQVEDIGVDRTIILKVC
jgi:hypothetical protein